MGVGGGLVVVVWVWCLFLVDDYDGFVVLLMVVLGLLLFVVINECGGLGFFVVYLVGLLVCYCVFNVVW